MELIGFNLSEPVSKTDELSEVIIRHLVVQTDSVRITTDFFVHGIAKLMRGINLPVVRGRKAVVTGVCSAVDGETPAIFGTTGTLVDSVQIRILMGHIATFVKLGPVNNSGGPKLRLTRLEIACIIVRRRGVLPSRSN